MPPYSPAPHTCVDVADASLQVNHIHADAAVCRGVHLALAHGQAALDADKTPPAQLCFQILHLRIAQAKLESTVCFELMDSMVYAIVEQHSTRQASSVLTGTILAMGTWPRYR